MNLGWDSLGGYDFQGFLVLPSSFDSAETLFSQDSFSLDSSRPSYVLLKEKY